MSDPEGGPPARRPRLPGEHSMRRELGGAALGAFVGAAIAQALGHNDAIVTAAIAGAFVGPGLIAFAGRALGARDSRRQ